MTYQDINRSINDLIRQALQKEFALDLEQVRLVQPPDPAMGDLSFGCFEAAGEVGLLPGEVASRVAKAVGSHPPYSELVDRGEAVGPYVNFFIKDEILFAATVDSILAQGEKVGKSDFGQGQGVLVEYSSPNTNKPQHIGHLRNNVLGDSLSRILISQGFKVYKVGIINDRGVHICKSMLMYQEYGEGKLPDRKSDHFVGYFYEMFEKRLADKPRLKEEAQEMLRRWERGDRKVRALWKKMNNWVYQGWEETYKILGVTFDKLYYESEVYEGGKEIVEQGLREGLFYKRDDGAVEINLAEEGLDKKVLLRADGTSVYITQDLYLAHLRAKEYPEAQKFIHVVGKDQEYHFKVLFSILSKLGLDKDYYHLSYGLVRLSSGKMSSRAGAVINADHLMQEVVALARQEVIKREENQGLEEDIVKLLNCYVVNQDKLSGEERRAVKIGLGALKYYLLQVDPKKDIVFDPKKAVSFEGNTGPYIMYTYARIRSIWFKAQGSKFKVAVQNLKLNTQEREIVNRLSQFSAVLQRAAEEYNPALLAHYLFELATAINSFYHKHPVLQAEESVRQPRLLLLQACGMVIKKGLGLLGIEAVDKM